MAINIYKASLEEAPSLYMDFILPNFPACEVKPLKSIIRMMESGLYSIICAKDTEPVGVAFITSYPNGEIYLLDYLAVDKKLRSKGLGGELLRACKGFANNKPVLIETEATATSKDAKELAERERRNRFYVKNGAKKSGVNTCIFGMAYDNWTLYDGPTLDDAIIQKGIEDIYRFMVNDDKLYDEYVSIPYDIKIEG